MLRWVVAQKLTGTLPSWKSKTNLVALDLHLLQHRSMPKKRSLQQIDILTKIFQTWYWLVTCQFNPLSLWLGPYFKTNWLYKIGLASRWLTIPTIFYITSVFHPTNGFFLLWAANYLRKIETDQWSIKKFSENFVKIFPTWAKVDIKQERYGSLTEPFQNSFCWTDT